MYSKSFYIEDNVGNNAFSYNDRKNKKIFVPKILNFEKSKNIKEDVEKYLIESKEIAFSEYLEKEENIFGLKDFLCFKENNIHKKEIYIFDNHNHSFYFISQKELGDVKESSSDVFSFKCILKEKKDKKIMIHFDQHKDTRVPSLSLDNFSKDFLKKKGIKIVNKDIALEILFNYTNFHLNVGNFIVPLIENNFIDSVFIVDSSYKLNEIINILKKDEEFRNSKIIVDIDLDFFSQDMDYINLQDKIYAIRECLKLGSIVTIATSPYFISFKRAKEYLLTILDNI